MLHSAAVHENLPSAFAADILYLPCPPVAQSSHRAQGCCSAGIHPLVLQAEERSAAGEGVCATALSLTVVNGVPAINTHCLWEAFSGK